MIPRVVIDTNIYLSAILFGGGPADLLAMAARDQLHILISEDILGEIRRKLLGKFRRPGEIVHREIDVLLQLSHLITPTMRVNACRDPDDNRILECAIAGSANFILTGDKDLLTLGSINGIPILTVRQFLDLPSTRPQPLP